MRTGYPLRFYANPVKLLLYLLIALGFTAGGLWMLQDPTMRANVVKTAVAYVAVVFFGLGTVVLLIVFLVYVVVRRPVLQIDAQGWSYTAPLTMGGQTVNWQDIAHIGIYRQEMQSRLSRVVMFYLVAHAKDPNKLPRPRVRAFSARFYPSLWGAAIAVPLNTIFVRTTSAKAEQLLGRILTACPYEIQLYGVQVSNQIHDL